MTIIQSGLVIYAKDHRKVATFYETILGLTQRHCDDEYVKLEASGLQIVVLKLPVAQRDKVELKTPLERRSNTAMKPVFFVKDIETHRDKVIAKGGGLNPADRIWQFDQMNVCDGFDCEGNVFQLRAKD